MAVRNENGLPVKRKEKFPIRVEKNEVTVPVYRMRSGSGYIGYVVRKHEGKVELYIDRGKDSDEENKLLFDTLQKSKEAIETDFGGPLEWQRLEGKRACRIMKAINVGGYRDEAKWAEIQDAMIEADSPGEIVEAIHRQITVVTE